MAADDTSRDALIERVARTIHDAADYEVPVMPWDKQTDDWRAEVSSLATAVVDAVVMPLVQENRELASECEGATADLTNAGQALAAAIKRAEAAEAAHEKLTEAVLYYAASYEDFPNKTVTERLIAPTLRQVGKDLRHILDERGAER